MTVERQKPANNYGRNGIELKYLDRKERFWYSEKILQLLKKGGDHGAIKLRFHCQSKPRQHYKTSNRMEDIYGTAFVTLNYFAGRTGGHGATQYPFGPVG